MKRAWLALILAACAATDPVGGYAARDLFARDGEHYVRVYLLRDGAASMQASDPGRAFYSEGRWSRLPDGRVAIDLTGDHREQLVFRLSNDQLVAAKWDEAYWGKAGPGVLYRVR